MKKLIYLSIVVFNMALILNACTGESIKNLNDYKVGDEIEGYTIAEIDQYGNIIFEGEHAITGNLFYNKPTGQIGINSNVFFSKVKIDDTVIDLSQETTIRFTQNPDELKKYLNESTLNENTMIRVKITDFKLQISKDNVGMFATVVEVLEVNGTKPEIQAIKEDDTERIRKLIAIREGEQIEGLIVKAVDYQEGSHFSITFEDELELSGEVTYNDFEESYDLNISDNPFATKFEDVSGIYDFMNVLNFKNKQKLVNALNKQQKDKLMQGQPVDITVKINNLTIGTAFDKGRLGTGAADFIELK